ncbi:hypothetical protein O181_076320 [Austropuccinia psidii MF-1]|uniref:Ribosome biogenesis regulatory protein n=1 Tax=Austropuccinia psidii MF-1 TaxID=1389203 RepID=A0A9Q3IEW6_9BASI|nr:hypothetical protein [Austropuccinia psidii MF-1]
MADVSRILALSNRQKKSVHVQRDIPIDLDVALLASFDPNRINPEEYNNDREQCLMQSARESIQVLVNSLFSLPTTSTDDGVVANLPSCGPSTILPRAKPIPKPAPLTKWQKFAKEKGIVPKSQKEKLEFDEEKQEWVNRWGWKGKNKDEENAWIREVKPGEEADGALERNPAKQARQAKKLKNDKQRLKNLQRANAELAKSSTTAILEAAKRPSTTVGSKAEDRAAKIAANSAKTKAEGLAKREEQAKRQKDVEELLQATKKSTASLGKFDKTFASEPKVKSVKRKFDPTEQPAKVERKSQMAIVEQLAKNPLAFKEKISKRAKKDHSIGSTQENKTKDLVNTRKAIRAVSGGRGASAIDSVPSKPIKKSKKRP